MVQHDPSISQTGPRTAMVSGGTSGIGLATARRLASAGFRVAICGRSHERLEAARLELVELAGDSDRVLSTRVDLAEPGSASFWWDRVYLEFGRVDVMVNNAAQVDLKPFDSITMVEFERTLNVNVRNLFELTQRSWKTMKRQGHGSIVNISSLAAVDPFPGFSLYGASKAWLETLSKALPAEGRDVGINVFCIRPGTVETPLLRSLFPDFPSEQCVSPEDIADAVLQCVSGTAPVQPGEPWTITNQTIA